MFATILLICATALFVISMVTRRYYKKYEWSLDGGKISGFIWGYRRIARDIPSLFTIMAISCVWFGLAQFQWALPFLQISSALILILVAFSLVCIIFLTIIRSVEMIFSAGDSNERSHWLRSCKEWRENLRGSPVDVLGSYFLTSVILFICGVMLWNMILLTDHPPLPK